MSHRPGWPAWFYGPNDQAAIFQKEEDVPPGWMDHPNKLPKDGDVPKIEPEAIQMTKREMRAALRERGIEFDAAAPASVLQQLLQATEPTEEPVE